MRRVISLWLPTWPTDRLRRRRDGSAPPDDQPLVTALHDGRRRVIGAADQAAQALGLRAGMPLAHAQAMVPGLAVVQAAPEEDAAALRDLAAWCLRYAPLTSADPPDGLWIDATGCEHLHGGELAMLGGVVGRLGQGGVTARAAVADTPGAAHALARHAKQPAVAVPPGEQHAAVAELPVAALRLPGEIVTGLRRLGFERVGQLAATHRAPLARRFGREIGLRLDQALGRVAEPIMPVFPAEVISHRLAFMEPLVTAEAFAAVVTLLVESVCVTLEQASHGARQLDLLFERVDGVTQAVRIGTSSPSRNPRHLARLLDERLEEVDPGLGVEAMRLVVPLAEPLSYAQGRAILADESGADVVCADLASLVDRLANRLGADRLFRFVPVESDVPERSYRTVPAMAPPCGVDWPLTLPRPGRLLDPPQPVVAMSALPDAPPAAFTWRRIRHRIRHADGPERIHGEWWRRDQEVSAVRDYWRVEDEDGRRFWLFRRGDGADPTTGNLSWFLHGLF